MIEDGFAIENVVPATPQELEALRPLLRAWDAVYGMVHDVHAYAEQGSAYAVEQGAYSVHKAGRSLEGASPT